MSLQLSLMTSEIVAKPAPISVAFSHLSGHQDHRFKLYSILQQDIILINQTVCFSHLLPPHPVLLHIHCVSTMTTVHGALEGCHRSKQSWAFEFKI